MSKHCIGTVALSIPEEIFENYIGMSLIVRVFEDL